MSRPWEWRKSQGGLTLDSDRGPKGRAFHAYDSSDWAACTPYCGLIASCEEPNEGSHFCPACMVIVRGYPDADQFDRDQQIEEMPR